MQCFIREQKNKERVRSVNLYILRNNIALASTFPLELHALNILLRQAPISLFTHTRAFCASTNFLFKTQAAREREKKKMTFCRCSQQQQQQKEKRLEWNLSLSIPLINSMVCKRKVVSRAAAPSASETLETFILLFLLGAASLFLLRCCCGWKLLTRPCDFSYFRFVPLHSPPHIKYKLGRAPRLHR